MDPRAEQHAATAGGEGDRGASRRLPGDKRCGPRQSLVDAVQGLDFSESEIVLVGSSRLAQPKRLFLGQSATKIMRALPVPMIVWPRD